ncbi:MAG: cytochrome c [Ignavibacteriaceae bacterium]
MNYSNYKDKSDEIKQNHGMLFGLFYPYILVIILAVGIYYLANEANVAQQKVPPLTAQPVIVTDLTLQQPKVIPPVDVNQISVPTPELIAIGSNIYKTTCASCHGDEGTGTGLASVGLNPAPRNFTKHEGWKNGETISGIFTTLQEGIPNSSMIAYDFLTPEEKFALAHYVRSEFIVDATLDDETDFAGLEILYNLSAGKKVAGQMPIESAMQLIAEQHKYKFDKITTVVENINTNTHSRTAQLLKNITDDLPLALSALENSDKWRKSEDLFMNHLTTNVYQNGFNSKIFNLNSDEWNKLYNYLNNAL